MQEKIVADVMKKKLDDTKDMFISAGKKGTGQED